jgi:hypothetical protein
MTSPKSIPLYRDPRVAVDDIRFLVHNSEELRKIVIRTLITSENLGIGTLSSSYDTGSCTGIEKRGRPDGDDVAEATTLFHALLQQNKPRGNKCTTRLPSQKLNLQVSTDSNAPFPRFHTMRNDRNGISSSRTLPCFAVL